MRLMILIAYLLFLTSRLYGQGGFIKLFPPQDSNADLLFQNIFYDEEDEALFVLAQVEDQFQSRVRILKLDTNGVVLKEKTLRGDSTRAHLANFKNNISKSAKGEYLVYGDIFFPYGKQFIYQFNADLDSIAYYDLPSDEPNIYYSTKSHITKAGWYLAGSSLSPMSFSDEFSLKKIRSNGDFLWERSYGTNFIKDDQLNHIIELPKGELLLAGTSFDSGSGTNSSYYFVQVDSQGNKINEFQAPQGLYTGPPTKPIYYLNNQGEKRLAFGSAQVTNQSSWNSRSKISYFITDMAGQIIDSMSFGELESYNQFYYNERVADGFIVVGQYGGNFIQGYSAIVCKISEFADTIWCKQPMLGRYPRDRYDIFISGMQIAASGSIFLCGSHLDFAKPQTVHSQFIMKLDRHGCLEPDCMFVSTSDISHHQSLHLYPNPATDYIYVELPSAGELRMYDGSGQLWLKKELTARDHRIDLSGMPTGLLIYELHGSNSTRRGKFIHQ